MNGYPRFGWVYILRFQQSDTMVPIHALQWYRFADTVTRIAISVEVRRGYIVFRRIFRIVSVVSAGVSVVTVELPVVSLMFLSCFRQVAILSGLPFSWSCLIYSRAVMAGVCDFENVKRYNVKTLTG